MDCHEVGSRSMACCHNHGINHGSRKVMAEGPHTAREGPCGWLNHGWLPQAAAVVCLPAQGTN